MVPVVDVVPLLTLLGAVVVPLLTLAVCCCLHSRMVVLHPVAASVVLSSFVALFECIVDDLPAVQMVVDSSVDNPAVVEIETAYLVAT